MAHSQYEITPPVSFADVQAVLVDSSPYLDALCTSARINQWARYKPFVSSVTGLPTEAQRQAAYYGLLPSLMKKQSGNFNELAWEVMTRREDTTVNMGGYWTYYKPYGGAGSPYRLQDFVDCVGLSSGYCHNSDVPVSISVDTGEGTGVTDHGNHELELALQTRTYITMRFLDIPVPHIPLWAFFQSAYNQLFSAPIRVRIGIYADSGSTPWYNRSTPVVAQTIERPALTAGGFTTFSVNVSFADSAFTSNTNKIYYVVVGFQRCNSGGYEIYTNGINNAYGMLPPFGQSAYANQVWPFLWKIRLANYFTRVIKFDFGNSTLGYATSSWFTYTAGYFTAQWRSGDLFLVCRISLSASIALTFVDQNGTSGGSGTKIQFAASCPIAHGETLYYASPANSSRQSVTTALVPTGSSSSFQTLYMWIDGNIRPSSTGYYTINIMARTYSGSSPSGDWVNATSLSIRIT